MHLANAESIETKMLLDHHEKHTGNFKYRAATNTYQTREGSKAHVDAERDKLIKSIKHLTLYNSGDTD